MKRTLMLFNVFFMISLCLTVVRPAQAALIVDTGLGASSGGGLALGATQNGTQWLAAEFITTQNFTINEILGWMFSVPEGGGTGTIALYSDGAETPGTEMFSTKFIVPNTDWEADWYGVSGLTWDLLAGTYWVAFEVRVGDTLIGGMPFPSANPLSNEAYFNAATSGYIAADYLNIGVRVDAQPMGVTEPSTLLLFGSGLLGLGFFARKKM